MATAFKQLANGAKALAVAGTLNNITSPLTFNLMSGGNLFPSPGSGFYVTAYNSSLYSDPNDDPDMRIGLCTARTGNSLTVTWGQFGTPVTAMSGTPSIRLLNVAQLLLDAYTAINTAEAGITSLQSAGYITGSSPVITTPIINSPAITGGGSWVGSPTLSTPAITSLVNMQHTHANAAGGGPLGAGAVIASMLGLTVSSQPNAGTAGGTMYYLNLGGIKLCWGSTAAVTIGASTSSPFTVTLPSSFFSTIQAAPLTIANNTVSDQMFPYHTSDPTATTLAISVRNQLGSAATTKIHFFVIGT